MGSQTKAISEDRVKSIKTFPSLVKFLRDELDWPIDQASFSDEDIAFDFSPEEIGLQDKFAAKVRTIKQIRPLEYDQPWGVFWIDFEPKHLPIGALRKILNAFVHKRRTKRSDQKTWATDDLLFIAGTGEDGHRGTTFAHFHKNDDGLEELKEFSWDEKETHFFYILDYLEGLKWPSNGIAPDEWRIRWRSAFKGSTRKSIKTAEQLAFHMAELARDMRKRVNDAFEVETEKGPLHEMYDIFKKVLIHDLEKDAFADMYAQTVTYGLFSARCMDTDGHFELQEVVDRIPETNPFLKGLFLACFKTVKRSKDTLDLDELGVMRLVELLDDLNQKDGSDRMQDILREFGRQTRGEDPVIHFYEGFLNAYESEQRKRRGVYYTPDPVVSYIVRSVDEILRKEFKLELGLADTSTWGDLVSKGVIKRPDDMHQSSKEWKALSGKPFVQILDPATGTGTFLKHTILLIHKTLIESWKKEGRSQKEIDQLWNDYVSKHLLTRIYGFELMMAPYAVCHMKLGLVLKETGYNFEDKHRLQVFLTNALEPPYAEAGLPLFDTYIAEEVRNSNDAKNGRRFTVVIGNPPYSKVGRNMSEWSAQLVKANFINGVRIQSYYEVDGAPLNERKVWLQDDYVKFIRLAQYYLQRSGVGVYGYITNRGFLGNPTFNGMRQSLLKSYQKVFVLDLHGDTNVGEGDAAGVNENVFDIQQGVALSIGVRSGAAVLSVAKYQEIFGSREEKYSFLSLKSDNKDAKTISCDGPLYLFLPVSAANMKEFQNYWSLPDIMPQSSSGIVTSRDGFVIGHSDDDIEKKVERFLDPRRSDKEVAEELDLSENYAWRVSTARNLMRMDKKWRSKFVSLLYRPFDFRRVILHDAIVWRTRLPFMAQMFTRPNIALLATRQASNAFTHVFCTRHLIEMKACSHDRNTELFPLEFSDSNQGLFETGSYNLCEDFISEISASAGLPYRSSLENKGLSAATIFFYIYAILHSDVYRTRYKDFLSRSYPRIPSKPSSKLFLELSQKGEELISLHLMESQKLSKKIACFIGDSKQEVEKVVYSAGNVWLNKDESCGFQGIPENVWSFNIGGYQVCEKWLKYRKGLVLSKEDIEHFQKIIIALSETIRLMAEIDQVIDRHGGWPGAFDSKK